MAGTLVAPRTKRQRLQLLRDRGNHARVAEADLMHPVAVEIHDAPALVVLDVDAVTGAQHVEAGRRERLVQEIPGVFVEQRLRRFVEVVGGPGCPARREVQVAFRAEVVQILVGTILLHSTLSVFQLNVSLR